MRGNTCSICKNPTVRTMIDASLEEKVSHVGISRHLAEAGLTVSPEVIGRHSKHYKPEYVRPAGTRKRDAAVFIRDRIMDRLESNEAQAGISLVEEGVLVQDFDILNKDLQPAIGSMLKAQGLIDSRERVKAKQGNLEIARAIIEMLTGRAPVLELEDGLTVEGDYEYVIPDG